METKMILWFAGMFFVGRFVYTIFGMQIGIVKNCAMKVHYMIRNDTEYFYSDACLLYLRKIKRKNRGIIIVIAALIFFFIPLIGFCGFVAGYILRKLTTSRLTGINDNNLADTTEIFIQFAKPGMESEFSEGLSWATQKLKNESIFKYI